jgi:multidrug resistance protein, MATE family
MALLSFSLGTTLSILFGFGIKIGPLQFPKMRQSGVALGFVIDSYIIAGSYGAYIKLNEECKKFDFYKFSIERARRNLDVFRDIIQRGGAMTLSFIVELALTLSVGIFSGLLGVEEQSAMSYCMQVIYFEFIMISSFSISCAQEISRKLGANDFRGIQKTAEYGTLTTLLYTAPLPIFFSIYPKALEVMSGGVSEETSKILRTLAPIMFSGLLLDSTRYNMLQQLRALGDLVTPTVISFIGMFGGIALAAVLGFETILGVDGIGMGYAIGVGVTAGALFPCWKYKIKEPASNDSVIYSIFDTPKRILSGCFTSLFYHSSRQYSVSASANHEFIEGGSSFIPSYTIQ